MLIIYKVNEAILLFYRIDCCNHKNKINRINSKYKYELILRILIVTFQYVIRSLWNEFLFRRKFDMNFNIL